MKEIHHLTIFAYCKQMFSRMCHLQILLKELINHLLKRRVNPQSRNGCKQEHRAEIILIDRLAMLKRGEKYRKENY